MIDKPAVSEIDFEHLKNYLGDDVSLTTEVFGLFKNQMDMWARHLDAQADDDSWSAMIHSIKGSARAVGANRLATQCEQAEQLVAARNSPAIRQPALQDILYTIDKILIEIGRWEYRQTLANMRSGN